MLGAVHPSLVVWESFYIIVIHNAWDSVTYLAIERRPKPDDPRKQRQRRH